ncbi:hypothetical protein DYB37_013025 [Aphanomyces astaci]|uniref:Uncharacterized protein n=1 Tax=Aphanomyces astaci TaxID=112090 RepID=A0A3R7BRE1_APHAT|nr:hypothetical protein DYB35_000800 [Aphanomyces astaci]RHZ32910.1 hypothetical protein DYB37_013025 [Aphanomyces astaci]
MPPESTAVAKDNFELAKFVVFHEQACTCEQQAAAELVNSAMHTVSPEAAGAALGTGGGRHEGEGEASAKGVAVNTEVKVKGECGGPERTDLARDEVFERELGLHWERSRIFTPVGWAGVDLESVRDIMRRLTVVGEFDETRDDCGYRTANVAVVERYLHLFASAQSFEQQALWMLLILEGTQLARVTFHRFDEFKGGMSVLYERGRLERWTVDVGRIELCNDETLLEYLVAFVSTLVGEGSGRHVQPSLTAERLANSLSNFAGVRRQKYGCLDARSVARRGSLPA